MTRLDEFKMMINAIGTADTWDAYPEYFERLCDWYEIDLHDIDAYGGPEGVLAEIRKAYKEEGGSLMKYWVIDRRDTEVFDTMCETEAEAIQKAETEWNHMTASERSHSREYAVYEAEEDVFFPGIMDYNTAKVIWNPEL